MSHIRLKPALVAGALMSLATVAYAPAALAADMPVKAAPVPVVGASVPLDVHGYADLTFANTRVTGGGLYLYSRGYLTQVDVGLSLDLYKNPAGFINSVTVFGGVWNEFWDSPPVGAREWQEMDWWVGFTVGFAKYWKFTAQHVQFNFPNAIPTAYNYDFRLTFDDSFLGLPVVFNPYVGLFYNTGGGSTVVLGKREDTYRMSVGMTPTIAFQKTTGIPLTLTMPTWVAFGPSEFWNRQDGTTDFCGATTTLPCAPDDVGFYSTGLHAKLALDAIVPKRLGNWYIKGGIQYYHIVNESLLAAQTVAGGVGSVATFPDAKKDIVVGFGGIGFSF